MAVGPQYLADTSALARFNKPPVAQRLTPLMESGLIARCSVVDLEMLYTARSSADYDSMRQSRRNAYPEVLINQDIFEAALSIQEALAHNGQHRGVSMPDLLIAATAAHHELIVVHYDHDYDLIADVTGQQAEWVVPPGSVS